MAKPNYQFEKRKRDLAKKAKKEEKRQRKLLKPDAPADGSAEDVVTAEGAPVEESPEAAVAAPDQSAV